MEAARAVDGSIVKEGLDKELNFPDNRAPLEEPIGSERERERAKEKVCYCYPVIIYLWYTFHPQALGCRAQRRQCSSDDGRLAIATHRKAQAANRLSSIFDIHFSSSSTYSAVHDVVAKAIAERLEAGRLFSIDVVNENLARGEVVVNR
jgi:hypothetical protein